MGQRGGSREVGSAVKVDEVRAEVDRIIDGYTKTWDDETAHSDEDALLGRLVRAYCPPEIVAEVERLGAADFQRWCA